MSGKEQEEATLLLNLLQFQSKDTFLEATHYFKINFVSDHKGNVTLLIYIYIYIYMTYYSFFGLTL